MNAARIAQAAAALSLAGCAAAAFAQQPAAQAKDVVVDTPQPAAAAASAPASAAPVAANLPPNVPPTAARRAQAATALADLGLHLARQSAQAQGGTRGNFVVSPYSVGATLGMLHAGATGSTAAEIAGVLEPAASGGRLLGTGLAGLPAAVKSDAASQWLSPSRIWVGRNAAAALSPVFQNRLASAYGADGALVDFAGAPGAAQDAINQWAAGATQNRIAQLLPPGSVKADTRMVLTNAAYFKGQWAAPFDAARTRPAPFAAPGGSREVPTMRNVVAVREGTIDNVYVLELPFEGGGFSLLLALPPAGHTLQALENDVMGADVAGWSAQLKPQRVVLALPKFNIAARPLRLNDALQTAGMRTAFTDAADFSGMVPGRGPALDSAFHSAAIEVNEEGTVASAATAAVVSAKSAPAGEPPLRAFDRPFFFVLLHKPTGAPLFMGRISEP
ncbi:MAG: serpin family protein [Pseudomonadota bacterium]